MALGSIKTYVVGLALISFSVVPALAAEPAGSIKPVGLFSKNLEDCAKDAKVSEKKTDAIVAGCDEEGGCDLLQRALNKTGLGGKLSDRGITASGWMQFGYHSDSTGLFNAHPDDFNLHQLYFAIGKVAEAKDDGIGVGFGLDLVYGVDGPDVQSRGNDGAEFDNDTDWDHGIYGWAMPQLFVSVAKGDLTVRAGHFYHIGGYENPRATKNFFYSHTRAMYTAVPRTLTGFVADYNLSDELTTSFGWVAGLETGFDRNNDGDASDGSALVASVGFEPVEGISLVYALTMGDFGLYGEGYQHSIVGNLDILDDLTYVVTSDMVESNAAVGNHIVSINQYVFYDINDSLSAGFRTEWIKTNGTSSNDITFGLNIKARDCLLIRPEVRTDWTPADGSDQSIFGIDLIYSY